MSECENLMAFKKPQEVTESELLRDALRNNGTKISVTSPEGRRWTFVNDITADCILTIQDITVTESGDKMDVLTRFIVRATNGRLG